MAEPGVLATKALSKVDHGKAEPAVSSRKKALIRAVREHAEAQAFFDLEDLAVEQQTTTRFQIVEDLVACTLLLPTIFSAYRTRNSALHCAGVALGLLLTGPHVFECPLSVLDPLVSALEAVAGGPDVRQDMALAPGGFSELRGFFLSSLTRWRTWHADPRRDRRDEPTETATLYRVPQAFQYIKARDAGQELEDMSKTLPAPANSYVAQLTRLLRHVIATYTELLQWSDDAPAPAHAVPPSPARVPGLRPLAPTLPRMAALAKARPHLEHRPVQDFKTHLRRSWAVRLRTLAVQLLLLLTLGPQGAVPATVHLALSLAREASFHEDIPEEAACYYAELVAGILRCGDVYGLLHEALEGLRWRAPLPALWAVLASRGLESLRSTPGAAAAWTNAFTVHQQGAQTSELAVFRASQRLSLTALLEALHEPHGVHEEVALHYVPALSTEIAQQLALFPEASTAMTEALHAWHWLFYSLDWRDAPVGVRRAAAHWAPTSTPYHDWSQTRSV